jgi:peptidoglycan/xylan/chitin deacetylase (PgdA/CDA1 family)
MASAGSSESGGQWLERASYAAKRAVSRILYGLGILQVWQALALRRRTVVLMYHRVLDDHEREGAGSHPALIVSRRAFAMQMRVLARRFTVLSVADLERRLARREPLPDSSCVITFDDGWRDNFTNAFPLLREHAFPAVVFLPPGYIGSRRVFWQEALAHLLRRAAAEAQRSPERRDVLAALLEPAGLAFVLDGEPSMSALFAGIGRQKTRPRAEIDALVERLAAVAGVDLETLAETDGFMSWDEVSAMAQSGITFGAHTVEHRLLTFVPIDEARCEIRESKRIVAERVGAAASAFSYPNGYLNPAIVDEVRAAGYGVAFGTDRGHVCATDDPFTIRRLNVHEAAMDTAPMFLARMVGLW